MYTNKNNRNKEMQKRYGHLLDKYINAADYPNPIFHKETSEYIKDVENGRYGHLLENTSDPAQETYDRMMRIQDMMMENRERRAKEEERAELIAKGRIQVEKINEKKHADRIQSFANGLMERKKAKIEAEAAQREEEKRRAREEKERIERFRHQTDSLYKTREITARAKEVMERRKKQEKEHNRQMEWYRNQKRG